MNNELLVCIFKESQLRFFFLSQREISICRFKGHLCGFKYFPFSVSDVFLWTLPTCFPLLNLLKWDTHEGINSHVVYAPIELQDPQMKLIFLHWRDHKKALPAITILWHSTHHDLLSRYGWHGGIIWTDYNRKYSNLSVRDFSPMALQQWAHSKPLYSWLKLSIWFNQSPDHSIDTHTKKHIKRQWCLPAKSQFWHAHIWLLLSHL